MHGMQLLVGELTWTGNLNLFRDGSQCKKQVPATKDVQLQAEPVQGTSLLGRESVIYDQTICVNHTAQDMMTACTNKCWLHK